MQPANLAVGVLRYHVRVERGEPRGAIHFECIAVDVPRLPLCRCNAVSKLLSAQDGTLVDIVKIDPGLYTGRQSHCVPKH